MKLYGVSFFNHFFPSLVMVSDVKLFILAKFLVKGEILWGLFFLSFFNKLSYGLGCQILMLYFS